MSAAGPGFKLVIPARLGSTRLPGKVLRLLAGKPLVQHVWELAMRCGAEEVWVAVDDDRVADCARGFGAAVCMTSAAHQSGTDRVNEVARQRGWADSTLVVNLQGDEPLMPADNVRLAAQLLVDDPQADIATLCHALDSVDEWLNPNVVKVVRDQRGQALYFSRAPIPWPRDCVIDGRPQLPDGLAFRHIGLYAYRVGRLAEISGLPPAALEQCEALEQLRAMAAGFRIAVGLCPSAPPRGVDTEADLRALEDWLLAHPG